MIEAPNDRGDEIVYGLPCPTCESVHTEQSVDYGYWVCSACGHVWALDADDPDYEELDLCL